MTRLRLSPTIRIPVPRWGNQDASAELEPPHILFYLQRTEQGRCFYECAAPQGCRGCGCPSFEVQNMTMPDWVLLYLKDHVRRYHTEEAMKDWRK